jgi:hypothetical protein
MTTVHLHCVQRTSWQEACQGVQCSVCRIRRKQTAKPSFLLRLRNSFTGVCATYRYGISLLPSTSRPTQSTVSDRRALEAALANEAARQLELAMRKAADGREPITAIRKMSSAYLKFARDNPHLYEAMMSLHAPGHDATSHQSLWTFTVEQVQRIAGSDRTAQASVALWAFLHGAATLEAAQVLGEIKPASGLEFGFEAWLMAVSTRREPVDALRIKPTKKRANKKVSARETSVRSGK